MKKRIGNLYRMCLQKEMIKRIKEELEVCRRTYAAAFEISKEKKITYCAAIVAQRVFNLTTRQWNAVSGCEYFAAVLAAIIYKNLWVDSYDIPEIKPPIVTC